MSLPCSIDRFVSKRTFTKDKVEVVDWIPEDLRQSEVDTKKDNRSKDGTDYSGVTRDAVNHSLVRN